MRKWNWGLYVQVVLFSLLIFVSGMQLADQPVHAQLGGNAGFTYTHISTATNTLVKSAQGQLHNIVINGGTLTGAITVVDTSAANCTGGQGTIAVIAANQVAGQNYSYDLQTVQGICIITAAAVDVTVDWR